jgi:hypothetical protein
LGAAHRRIVGAVNPAVDDIRIGARDLQPLDPVAVDERDSDHRRKLPHQPQDVEAVPLVAAVTPR